MAMKPPTREELNRALQWARGIEDPLVERILREFGEGAIAWCPPETEVLPREDWED